jgi:hypothetical protein
MSVLTIQSRNLYSSLNFLAWESLRCYHELSVVDQLFSSWSKVSNYARKVGLGFGFLGYGISALFTAPFGIALKQVVTRITAPFTLVRGEAPPKVLQGQVFSVFSANECLMPGGFFASKFAVEDLDIASFPEETSSMLCKRAYAAFTLTSEGFPFARIFTTHLTSSENDLHPTVAEKQARKIQLELVVTKVREFIGKDLALLFCGDLNSSREELISHSGFILEGCSADGKNAEAVHFLDGNSGKVPTWGGEKGVPPLELDYVFLVKGSVKGSASKVETEVRATTFLAEHLSPKATSDHYSLLSEVVLHKD